MTSLLWLGLIIAGLVGMLVGSAINREYRRTVLLRAQRAEAALAQLQRDFLVEESVERRPVEVPMAAQPASVVVHVHMSPQHLSWPQPPVIDAQIVPVLPGPEVTR